MPWEPSYTQVQARAAINGASSWKEVLAKLGYRYHGKNIETLRKWARRWGIPVDHLPDHRRRSRDRRRYSEAEARAAIAASRSWAEALRHLDYCHTGANPKVLKARAARWRISTDHFDPYAAARSPRPKIPLTEILVEGSTYSRHNLKERLYRAGLKQPRCERCGQGELWRGERMSLILDHTNGIRDDNRLENLRILCPNCAAVLDTHCGRKNRAAPVTRRCEHCGESFRVAYKTHRYCSPRCFHDHRRAKGSALTGVPQPRLRKVERPPYERLLAEVEECGYLGVGRRYGVSDNAVRKWVRQYEREWALAEGRDPAVVEIPTRTWPNRKRRAA